MPISEHAIVFLLAIWERTQNIMGFPGVVIYVSYSGAKLSQVKAVLVMTFTWWEMV